MFASSCVRTAWERTRGQHPLLRNPAILTTLATRTPSRSHSMEPSTGRRSGSGSACCCMPEARTCYASKGFSTSARRDPSSSTACSTPSIRRSTSASGPTRTTAPGSSLSPSASSPKSYWTPYSPSTDYSGRDPYTFTPSRAYRSRSRLKDFARWVMRPLTTPVRGCRTSVKITRRAPVYGDARSGRRHRHLGRATCDEHGKDHTDGSSVLIAHAACEHEPAGPRNALGSGGDARIGWLEAETVAALDRA